MSITKEDVLRAGKLARIKIMDIEKVSKQMHGIFDWIDQLNKAHSQIKSTELVVQTQNRHLERADENPTPDQRNLILINAPHRVLDFFAVPKVKE